jgi:hypothetical protein
MPRGRRRQSEFCDRPEGGIDVRRRNRRPEPAAPQQTDKPAKPRWQEHLDSEERPSREDRAAGHDPFTDSILEPVPLPRWLRGRRRTPRDKLS